MRVFISLELPKLIIESAVKAQEALRGTNLFEGKFTNEENIHLTLKFLGELDVEEVEWVKGQLETVEPSTYLARLGEVGVFSNEDIRIIWVHLDGVNDLQELVDRALAEKYKPEHRFMSHITLARVKQVENPLLLLSALEGLRVDPIAMPVRKISLMQSDLTPTGPVYTEIASFPQDSLEI